MIEMHQQERLKKALVSSVKSAIIDLSERNRCLESVVPGVRELGESVRRGEVKLGEITYEQAERACLPKPKASLRGRIMGMNRFDEECSLKMASREWFKPAKLDQKLTGKNEFAFDFNVALAA